MQIEIIEQLDDVAALKPDWDALYERAQPGLFMHHSWVFNNFRFLPPDRILLLTVYGDGRKLIGVFPFAVQSLKIKWLSYRALTHGGSIVTDYSMFMADPEANSRLMTKRIIEKLIELQPGCWDFIKIDNLSNGSDSAGLFMNLAIKHLYSATVPTDITPIVKFDNEYAEAKKISNIKRRFRKIADDCSIDHLNGLEIDPALMQEFSELHQQSFPGAGFDREQTQAFYRALIEDNDFNRHVRLSTIGHEGRMIAAHFGFADDLVYYYYVPTYNEKYSTNGPGQYLLWCLINRAKDEGMSEFDLLRGSEDYKFNWTNKINTNYTLFGVTREAGCFRRLLVNLWILTRSIPYFNPRHSD